MCDKIKDIKKHRADLSNYLMHFISNNPVSGLDAFAVLQKIINDGYLECGWSIQKGKRTIFGQKPAVCFTEMPLFAFFDYVVKRGDLNCVNNYGIALLTQNLFIRGARNVLYGTTNYTVEKFDANGNGYLIYYNENADAPEVRVFRDDELYRYMLTGIGEKNDWTHEREWRWVDYNNKIKNNQCLPLWSYQETSSYGKDLSDFFWDTIFIIVQYEDEVPIIKSMLSKQKGSANILDNNISVTKIICKETLMKSSLPEHFGFSDIISKQLFVNI